MKISYKLKAAAVIADIKPETIQACDEGFKAYRHVLILTAKHVNPWLVPVIWIYTRFYRRTITAGEISYNLYLLQ